MILLKKNGISIKKLDDGKPLIRGPILLGRPDCSTFCVRLLNIPKTEMENIKITAEDESIIDVKNGHVYDGYNYGAPDFAIVVEALKLGNTKLTASITYEGITYTDSCPVDVLDSLFKLNIVPEKDVSNIKVNDTAKLNAILSFYDGTIVEETEYKEMAENWSIEWRSSDPNVVEVDQSGIIEVHSEGDAVITAKAEDYSDSIVAAYNIKIIGDASSSDDKAVEKMQQNDIIKISIIVSVIVLVVVILISIFAYIKHRKHKNMK